MSMHSNMSKMKKKILSACLQENYQDSLGEFSKMSWHGMFGAERDCFPEELHCC